jgi:hypothetical protein
MGQQAYPIVVCEGGEPGSGVELRPDSPGPGVRQSLAEVSSQEVVDVAGTCHEWPLPTPQKVQAESIEGCLGEQVEQALVLEVARLGSRTKMVSISPRSAIFAIGSGKSFALKNRMRNCPASQSTFHMPT